MGWVCVRMSGLGYKCDGPVMCIVEVGPEECRDGVETNVCTVGFVVGACKAEFRPTGTGRRIESRKHGREIICVVG